MQAAIDIGTNSVRLFVGQKFGKDLQVVERATVVTRLGQDVDKSGSLDLDAMERTIRVLCDFKNRNVLQNLTPLVVATSAVRDARNRLEFMTMVQEVTGWPVKVLSGTDEAIYSLKGALETIRFEYGAAPVVVVDIGGGSTELFAADMDGTLLKGGSLQIGAVRMTERFITAHPVEKPELVSLEQYVTYQLQPLIDQLAKVKPNTLVAVGGTATTLAAMQLALDEYSPEKVTGLRIKLSDLEHTYYKLAGYSLPERTVIPGLQQGREDIIVAGLAILKQAIRLFPFNEVTISDGDLLQGLILANPANSENS